MRSLVFCLLVGCGQPAPQATTPIAPGAHDPTCPLEVPGTAITVEDAPEGAAMVFVTTGDARAVQAAADAFVAAHPSATSGFAGMVAKSATVTAQRISGGAKLLFTGADAPAIQSELRMHADHMSAGSCAMAM